MRRSEVRFGTFAALVGVAVHANCWWLRVAEGVKIEGTVLWRSFGDGRLQAESLSGSFDPDYGSPAWFVDGAVLALQCDLTRFSRPLVGGFIACHLQDEIDVAYPLLLSEEGSEVQVGFSSGGPSLDIQQDILAALGYRFLYGRRPNAGTAG